MSEKRFVQGWGVQREGGGKLATQLRYVGVKVIPQKICKKGKIDCKVVAGYCKHKAKAYLYETSFNERL